MINKPDKTKNPFSLSGSKLQIYSKLSERFSLTQTEKILFIKKKNCKTICIFLEKGNYNDIGTPLDFRQEKGFKNTTLP